MCRRYSIRCASSRTATGAPAEDCFPPPPGPATITRVSEVSPRDMSGTSYELNPKGRSIQYGLPCAVKATRAEAATSSTGCPSATQQPQSVSIRGLSTWVRPDRSSTVIVTADATEGGSSRRRASLKKIRCVPVGLSTTSKCRSPFMSTSPPWRGI
jgi:hypothetical protein